MRIRLTRDSVAMGDDALAPHEQVVDLADPATLGAALEVARHHTASISGGRATWVVRVGAWGSTSGRAVAVVAQQWADPVLLEDPATPLSPEDAGIHLDYLTQRDPDVVLAELRAGLTPARRAAGPRR